MVKKTTSCSIAAIVREKAREFSDNPVFSFEGETISYTGFDRSSNQAANGLIAQGIKKRDRVAFLGKNSPVYFELIVAAAKTGAVVTPINWRLVGPELLYLLNDCQAKLIFADAEFCETLASIRSSLLAAPTIYVIRGEVSWAQSYDEWRVGFDAGDPMLDESVDDEVVQHYTSGTTGRPKGVVLTSRALQSPRGEQDENALEDWQRYEPGETVLLVMPCFHVGGTTFGLSLIGKGAHAVVIPEYDPNDVLSFIETYRIGRIFMVPAALQMLLANPRINEVDFSSLRYIFYGASPIPLELMRESMERFGCGFVQMYGMTETGGTIVALPPEDHEPKGNKKMHSVGKPLWGIELKIIDEGGNSLPVGSIGEIATRSEKNMQGYWNLPEATRETIDSDGWLRTGDAGYLDDDGYLYIHDRVKDMIISGGENVYPAEVENVLYSHPDITDVAVVGVPDDKWGEAIKAFVVVKDGVEVDPQDIITFMRTRIASFKCPKSVHFMDVLPRNPSGKVLRRKLREPFWQGKAKGVN